MTADASNFSARQEKALVALLRLGEVKAAAEEARVSDVTLHRWLKDETFKAAYRAGRRELIEVAVAGLQADAQKARTVLLAVAEDKNAPASARVSAARVILEQSVKGAETLDLMERIAALEKLVELKGAKR